MRSVSKPLAKHLKDRLLAERDVIVASDIGYRMLGKNMVLPDTCIDTVDSGYLAHAPISLDCRKLCA